MARPALRYRHPQSARVWTSQPVPPTPLLATAAFDDPGTTCTVATWAGPEATRRAPDTCPRQLPKWVIHFTATCCMAHSRLCVARHGRSSGGWARLPGRERGLFTPGGLIAFGCGLATSCR